jgi:hypothetical protein
MPRIVEPASLLVLALLRSVPALAQEEVPAACEGVHGLWAPLPEECFGVIDTDRPHQTDTPHVVPAGHTQVESAIASLQLGGLISDVPRDPRAHLVLLDDNYKFGIVTDVDVQLLFQHVDYVPADRSFLPPGPYSVRAKFNIVHERGWVPAITLVPWTFLPVQPAGPVRSGPYVFWGWELPYGFELEMNAGALASTRPKPPLALVLATALTYTLVGEFRAFVDVYATGWDIALGTGLLWAFARNVQVDLGSYIGLSGAEPAATPFIGFSIRR